MNEGSWRLRPIPEIGKARHPLRVAGFAGLKKVPALFGLGLFSSARCVRLSYSCFDDNWWVSSDLGPVVEEPIRGVVPAGTMK